MLATGATEETCHTGNFPLVLENLKWVPVWEKVLCWFCISWYFVPLSQRQINKCLNMSKNVSNFLNRLTCEQSEWLYTKGNYGIVEEKLETRMVILNYNKYYSILSQTCMYIS